MAEKVCPELAKLMKEKHVSYRMLGEALGGLTPQNIARRLEGKTKWTLHEVIGVCRYFKIRDVRRVEELFGVRLDHTTQTTNSQEVSKK